MKNIYFIILALILSVSLSLAQDNKASDFREVAESQAQILQDGKEKKYCPICGMTLRLFYKTNHLATVEGKIHQYCSIHCLLEEAFTKKLEPKNIKVVDNSTFDFIDVNKAFYVVGSSKPATMSKLSSYAFGTKEAAESFAKKFGGEIMDFSSTKAKFEVLLEQEMAMIKKNQAKAAKMGEQIYNKICKKTDKNFKTTAEAKNYIDENRLCGNLKGKKLQQVALFLSKRK